MRNNSYRITSSPTPPSEPIKSPSPDQSRMNILTPTKIKYLGQSNSIRGFDVSNGYKSETDLIHSNNNTNNKKNRSGNVNIQFNVNSSHKRGNEISEDYVFELENKVNYLTEENLRLNRKLEERGSTRKNSVVIDKIKEQYQENIATLKMMAEQQIRESIGIIEDACQALSHQINQQQGRVSKVEMQIHNTKLNTIFNTNGTKATTTNRVEYLDKFNENNNNNNNNNHNNSISDFLGVSIPEEQWQESKNYTVTIVKLQEEVERMKQTIAETEQAYKKEISQLRKKMEDKDTVIKNLEQKLYRSERSQQSNQSKKFSKQIKQELIMLYNNVNQMAKELQESQKQYFEAIGTLEEKNSQIQILTRDVLMLRDKVIGHQQHSMLLEEKNRFLEGNINILERELKERKQILEENFLSKSMNEKQRVISIKMEKSKDSTISFLELTSRIDKLLQLEDEREKELLINSNIDE